MTDPSVSTDLFAPYCGCDERVVFLGKVKGTTESVCVCLEPGLQYGFHYGAAGKPLKVSFSVDGMQVRGDFDWQRIDGIDWASLSASHEGVTYTVWVSRPETADDLPLGRLEIRGSDQIDLEIDPASITHDLLFD